MAAMMFVYIFVCSRHVEESVRVGLHRTVVIIIIRLLCYITLMIIYSVNSEHASPQLQSVLVAAY